MGNGFVEAMRNRVTFMLNTSRTFTLTFDSLVSSIRLNIGCWKVRWMFHVDTYFRVRRACLVEGMSVREASRVFGLHRDTVRKMLANATPQGYTRKGPPREPKIEPFTGVIDAILEADRRAPRKQRHTAKRIFERLRTRTGSMISTR